MVFQIDGTDKKSGEPKTMTIEARDQAAAAMLALNLGIMVSEIRPVAAAPTSPTVIDGVTVEVETEAPEPMSTRPAPRLRPRVESSLGAGLGDYLVYIVFIVLAVVLVVSGLRDLSWSAPVVTEYNADNSTVEWIARAQADALLGQEATSRRILGMIKITAAILVALLIEAVRLRTLLAERLRFINE